METTYEFDSIGNATISHTIDLTNKLSHIYPTTYNLSISSGDIKDVKVNVMGDSVSPQVDNQNSTTSIHIPVRNPKIGKDQKTTLNITYNTLSFAEIIGDTVTITLPKTAKGNEAESFIRRVVVPNSYPELSYSSLKTTEASNSGQSRYYVFTGSGDQNLTLHFGTTASYDLKLFYLLKNTTSITATSELALPPDTAYQRVVLNDINPKPTEIVIDSDGNWLARYLLPPLSKLDVKADLSIIVSPTPIYFDPSSSAPMREDEYWEQSSSIKQLATNLKNPKNLYNYLIESLSYDYTQISRQKRLGANATLSKPDSSICTEFTDLFVATSRAMGIPSRAIIGYAVTSNNTLKPQSSNIDILHAYPEYQDPSSKAWKSVDPTWGHTTGGSEYFDILDFGHITFVRWGASSSYPLPAGSYRENRTGKQIEVTIRESSPKIPETSYKLESVGKTNYLVNSGKAAIINEKLMINNQEVSVTYLPPYGKLQITNIKTESWHNLFNIYKVVIAFLTIFLLSSLLYIIWKKRRMK
ncbi:MAG: hypothetical protein Fur0011_4730 [Candidatus Microgenomates bacterium]